VWSIVYQNALILRDTGSGPMRLYFTQDANFNITSALNTSGAVQEYLVYDGYGKFITTDASWTVQSGDPLSLVFTYQGGRQDLVTGFIHFDYRDYNPRTAIWNTRDPLGYVDGLNDRAFVADNPINRRDPAGLSVIDTTWHGIQNMGIPLVMALNYLGGTISFGALGGTKIEWGEGSYFHRLITQSQTFQTARDIFLEKISKTAKEWSSKNSDAKATTFPTTGTFNMVVLDTETSDWHPYNWFTTQLTIGRTIVNYDAQTVVSQSRSGDKVSGSIAVTVIYDVLDKWHLRESGHEPGIFFNHVTWSEKVVIPFERKCPVESITINERV